jgi:AraC-like DNA-binding protein
MSDEQDSAAAGPLWSLSTDAFEGPDKFDAWNEALRTFNDVRVNADDRATFGAATSYFALGRFTLVRSAATPLSLFRSEAMAARDQLDQNVVIVFLAGESVTRKVGGDHRLASGDVGFGSFQQGYEFNVTSAGTAQWIELICPPDMADMLAGFGSGALEPGAVQTPQSRLLGQFIASLSQRLPELSVPDIPLIEQALMCLLAAAQRASGGAPTRLTESARHIVDRARVVTLIENELFSARLTADRVCGASGLSRSSLYRLFESEGGVASYIRTRRLDTLRTDLADPRKSRQTVAELAEARGFHSPSTLNRAFRRRFGCTPGDVRVIQLQAPSALDPIRIDSVVDYLRSQRPRVV